MAYWVGVVGSREGVERLRTNDDTWWCISKKAKQGDLIALYVARNRLPELPEEQAGFTAIFEIVGPEPERVTDCRSFGGSSFGGSAPVPVKIMAKQRFAIGLRLAEMKLDKVLASAKFVRRSFQGTYFEASPAEFSRIRRLLTKKINGDLGTSLDSESQ